MKVTFSKRFFVEYENLERSVQKRIDRKLQLLSQNIQYPGLGVKKMVNTGNIYEARVDIHNRMTFQIHGDIILMRRVGTHEIYRKP
jgi:mRNA-degrading endonuclease RelE of RelBE toxin-antitoxin system